MKFTTLLLSAFILIGMTIVMLFVAVFLFSPTGCGCISPPAHFLVKPVENSTGSYINVTVIDSKDSQEIKTLKLISNDGNNMTTQYVNTSLVPGSSYLFKVNRVNGTQVTFTVGSDGNEMVVWANDF
jgi:hypothetical protein